MNQTLAADATVTLADGFSLRLQWGDLSVLIKNSKTGEWNISGITSHYATYTVGCSSDRYFTTHPA